MRKGVLEGVFPLGEQGCLVEELGSLEMRQVVVQSLLLQLSNSP